MEKALVIIPAFNEEGSVGKVVELLEVNDGSTDLTSEKAKARGAMVQDFPISLGIRGAMQSGHQYTFEKGYDIAI
jgi:glycosyltransferase involved in cell wall biosynthesis